MTEADAIQDEIERLENHLVLLNEITSGIRTNVLPLKDQLDDLTYGTSRIYEPADVLRVAANLTRLPQQSIFKAKGAKNFKVAAHARWACMKAIRNIFGLSYPEIGKIMGCDHSTVIYGIRKLKDNDKTYLGILKVRANTRKQNEH